MKEKKRNFELFPRHQTYDDFAFSLAIRTSGHSINYLPKQRPKRPENAWFMYYLPCPSWSLRVAGEHMRLTSSVSSLLLRLMLMDENGWEILM